MGQNQDTLFSKEFLKHLRNALNHLYDPDQLRQSPLATFFHVEGRFDTPSAVQRILTRSIESFKCAPDSPAHGNNQQVYELLLYRYIQHISQEEHAHQLGMSVRQFRREQNQAIYELGCRLWQEHAGDSANPSVVPEPYMEEAEPVPDVPPDQDENGELLWIKNISPEKSTDVSKAIDIVLDLIAPLARQKEVTVRRDPVDPCLLAVHPVALQQILLGLLSYTVDQSPGEVISITFASAEQTLDICIHFPAHKDAPPASLDDGPAPQILQSILELCGGKMAFSTTAARNTFRITFTTVKPRTVLVIEDNDEIVALMQRYVLNMNYTITPIRDPARSIPEALETRPSLIVLDVMMPQVDGLEVLSQLKRHPELSKIPVIVCSVLPQHKLALALGAAEYLQKPIRRDVFIAALERHSTSAG
jgi:CheY-like chemotaxis protein